MSSLTNAIDTSFAPFPHLLEEFRPFLRALWKEYKNLDRVRDEKDILTCVCQCISEAFEVKMLFLAEQTTDLGVSTKFRICEGSWYYKGSKNSRYHRNTPSKLKTPFWSPLLERALQNPLRTMVLEKSNFALIRGSEVFATGRHLSNFCIVCLSFGPDTNFFIGVSLFAPDKDNHSQEIWSEKRQILDLFCRLVATPLRIENEIREEKLFRGVVRAGSTKDIYDITKRILGPRIHMSWLASKSLNYAYPTYIWTPNDAPTLSTGYDDILAYYFDTAKYVVSQKTTDGCNDDIDPCIERFAEFLDPSQDIIGVYVPFGRKRVLDNLVKIDENSLLSRYALARSLIWMSYKSGSLPGGDDERPKCAFAKKHDHSEECECRHIDQPPKCVQVFEKVVGIEPELRQTIGNGSSYASWLRCLWTEIYYRSRRIKESPGLNTLDEIERIAVKFSFGSRKTKEFLDKALKEVHEGHAEGISLNWRWLYLWLLRNALASKSMNIEYGHYDSEKNGIETHLEYYLNVSTSILFGLHVLHFWKSKHLPDLWDIPELRPHDLAQAKIYVLCQYAYLEIGVDHSWEIEKHLNALFQPEMVLYASSSAHRDHAFHVIDVCLLGHLLLSSKCGTAASGLARSLGVKGVKGLKESLKTWYPTALLHDTGIPIALASRIPDLLKRLSTSDMSDYTKHVRKEIRKAHRNFDKAIEKQFCDIGIEVCEPQGISFDHGAVSVNHLIHGLKRRCGAKANLDAKKGSLQAIFRHNRISENVKVKEDKMAFLLMLCDHLQEWGRTRFRPEHLARAFLSSLQMLKPVKPEVEHAAEDLLLENAYYDEHTGCLLFSEQKVTFDLKYLPSAARLMEPSCQWVDICRDFERVEFPDRFPVQIELKMTHPKAPSLSSARTPLTEMRLLRDFSATSEGSFLADWLKDIRNPPLNDDAKMVYSVLDPGNTGQQAEVFILRLGKVEPSQTPLLPYVPDDFYAKFFRWKERRLGLDPEDE